MLEDEYMIWRHTAVKCSEVNIQHFPQKFMGVEQKYKEA